jgi:hypothetical protein
MKIVFCILLIVFSGRLSAQSFFHVVPKINEPRAYGYERVVAPTVDSTMNAFRPLANIAAYAEPGNILMAGAGISYQHLKWIATTQKWNCVWSLSGMAWAGGSVAPSTPAQAVSFGLMVGILNNLIMVGPALNGNKVQAVISVGISLNN